MNYIIGALFLFIGVICFIFPQEILKYDLALHESYLKVAIIRFGGILAIIISLVFCFSS